MHKTNIWKPINRYPGYEVSYDGEIRKVCGDGTYKIMKPYIQNDGRKTLFVRLTREGKRDICSVHSIVAEEFLGDKTKDEVIYHKNGLIQDNSVPNLGYITRSKLGKMTGPTGKRKAVVKINKNGEIVDVYSSAREAGRRNFMSYQTVIDRCDRKVKSPFAPDGYAYAWENSEISMKYAISKIREYKMAAE